VRPLKVCGKLSGGVARECLADVWVSGHASLRRSGSGQAALKNSGEPLRRARLLVDQTKWGAGSTGYNLLGIDAELDDSDDEDDVTSLGSNTDHCGNGTSYFF